MFPDVKAAEDVTSRIRQVIGYLRYSPKETGLVFAALFAAALGWLVQSDPAKQVGEVIFGEHWPKITFLTSVALWTLFGALLILAFTLIWRQVAPPPASTDAAPRPSAIKGPMSFGPRDAELFRRLGRKAEANTLLDWIVDDQIGLIVLKGDSGAGKTSLLRAGLPGLLATHSSPIGYVYWEAVPDQAITRLLNAVKAGWGTTENGAVPQKLSDLSSSGEDSRRRVIVLDQFEQLSPGNSAHQPIFRLLKNAVLGMPPYRTTYIVAFRADYASTWFDFQCDQLASRNPAMLPLRLFSEQQAKEIIAVITEAAEFTVDENLVDDLLVSMKNDEGSISPVDTGITLLALNERALTKGIKHLGKGDYQIGGGSTGLLAEYISGKLDRYRPDERSKVVLSMLELADLGNDKRLAQGLPPDQLASKAGLPLTTMQRYLQDLSSPQVRLLEFISSTETYRLAHERLIPALRQLAGLVLAEAERAGREFNRAYSDWVTGGRSRKLLLSGQQLGNVTKYRSQLHWDTDRQNKEAFLKASLRWRTSRRYIASGVAAALLAIAYFGWEQLKIWGYERDLAGWSLPTTLVKMDQLTSFSLTNEVLNNLRWLPCSFSELKFKLPRVENFEDLRWCKNLMSLALDLTGSNINAIDTLKDLKDLNALTNLRLDLGSNVNNIDALKYLKSLTNLTLHLGESKISNIDPLVDLKGLTNLALSLGSNVNSIDALKGLNALTNLTLHLGSNVNSIDALKDLKGRLTNLTLDLSESKVSIDALKDLNALTNLRLSLGSNVNSIDALKGLNALTNLTLDLARSQVSSIDVLSDLNALTDLELNLDISKLSSIDVLRDLSARTNLTLYLHSNVSSIDALKVLKDLSARTNLTLSLDSNVNRIGALKDLKGLANLAIVVLPNNVSSADALDDLRDLRDLKDLTNLRIFVMRNYVSSVDALEDLRDLKELTNLTLDLGRSQVSSIDALKYLNALTNLRLSLGSNVNSIDALKGLNALTNLTLDLGRSQVSSIDALKYLKGLTNLGFSSGESKVSIDALKDVSTVSSLELMLSSSVDLTFLGSFEKLQTLRVTNPQRYTLDQLPKSLRNLVLSDKNDQGALWFVR
jgi:hypothetical protein